MMRKFLYAASQIRVWRKRLGWTQAELARRTGCHVQSVKYWERKRGRVSGDMIDRFAAVFSAPEVLAVLHAASKPVPGKARCGARTRKGEPCRAQPMPGRKRCKFHGGMSTGPKTSEGRARIASAQRGRRATDPDR